MYEFEVGDTVYDSYYQCLVKIIEIKEDAKSEVKSLKSGSTYQVWGLYLFSLDKAVLQLQKEIDNRLNLIKEIENV